MWRSIKHDLTNKNGIQLQPSYHRVVFSSPSFSPKKNMVKPRDEFARPRIRFVLVLNPWLVRLGALSDQTNVETMGFNQYNCVIYQQEMLSCFPTNRFENSISPAASNSFKRKFSNNLWFIIKQSFTNQLDFRWSNYPLIISHHNGK